MASQNQNSSVNTEFNLENVALDTSTNIGLQGDDLANVLLALNQKDAMSQTAILAQNQQLTSIIDSNNATTQNTVNSLKKWNLWAILGIAGGVGVLVFILKRKRK